MIKLAMLACFYSLPISTPSVSEPVTKEKRDSVLYSYEKAINHPQNSTKDVWDYAYMGEWNLTHKLCLIRGFETRDEMAMGCLTMAYLAYRQGDEEGMYDMFQSLDRYIEQSHD